MQCYLAIAHRTISYILTIAYSLQSQGSTPSRMLTTPATPPHINRRVCQLSHYCGSGFDSGFLCTLGKKGGEERVLFSLSET